MDRQRGVGPISQPAIVEAPGVESGASPSVWTGRVEGGTAGENLVDSRPQS